MNYSSIFHYLSFGENNVNREFDFKAFRLVGLEAYYTDYIENKNINNLTIGYIVFVNMEVIKMRLKI